ncbi:hypothetical protein [Candidatus Uabimicrobium amorphum]|uniref:Uncharacterized protein n=1 Tax=Uabimicrobium amorphum TaxID=2596890 RepID=A0A5S9ISV1_UABAM|nr:hypothetical protein [Candidatus Uabimicrobium amorphum]BBM87479.1 hypothetical protein UABAM_05891 [Candidatus Uabimicrobium amorphum]
MVDYVYKENAANEIVETWQRIESYEQIHIGEYLYYVSDNYFGEVVGCDGQEVRLKIQNFRINTVAYEAKIHTLTELLRPIENIYIDGQIQQLFPEIHCGLEKCFRIWKKIESYILDTPKEDRGKITPELFASIGRIFGKWSGKGFLNKSDIEELQQKQFLTTISQWIPLDKVVDNEPHETLEYIDKLLVLPYEKARETTSINLKDWLALRSGFFVKRANL